MGLGSGALLWFWAMAACRTGVPAEVADSDVVFVDLDAPLEETDPQDTAVVVEPPKVPPVEPPREDTGPRDPYRNCYEALLDGVPTGQVEVDLAGDGLLQRVYCDQDNDDGGWTRVFHHEVDGGFYTMASDALLYDHLFPPSQKYSILENLEDLVGDSGAWTFRMSWPDVGLVQIWTQTSNPTQPGPVVGYAALLVDTTAQGWQGLAYNGGDTLIDGTGTPGAWWYAIGAVTTSFGDRFPGPGVLTTGVDLWVRPDLVCGDGRRELTEACDDGNLLSGDGCDDTCQVE